MEKEMSEKLGNLTRYFIYVANLPVYVKYFGKLFLCDKSILSLQNEFFDSYVRFIKSSGSK